MQQIILTNKILRSWDKYYEGDMFDKIYTDENITHRVELEEENIYVHSSEFHEIHSTEEYGGVFYLKHSSSTQRLLFESITFVNCSVILSGGCIYIYSSGKNVLDGVCSYHCWTHDEDISSSGQVYCSEKSNANVLYQVSGEGCGYGEKSLSPIYLKAETNTIEYVNVSKSFCEYYSGMLMFSNSQTSYSTFTNNTAIEDVCICFFGQENNIMSYCNVFYNIHGSSSQGTINSYSPTISISDSVFIGNNAEYMFYCASGTFTVSNCHIGENQGTYFSVNVLNTVPYIHIHILLTCINRLVVKKDCNPSSCLVLRNYRLFPIACILPVTIVL